MYNQIPKLYNNIFDFPPKHELIQLDCRDIDPSRNILFSLSLRPSLLIIYFNAVYLLILFLYVWPKKSFSSKGL